MKKWSYISLLFLLGCFPTDEYLPGIPDSRTIVNLNVRSNQAAYLDLSKVDRLYDSTNGVWNLRFDNKPNAWGIYLNTLQATVAFNTKSTDFDLLDETYNTNAVEWEIDIPSQGNVRPAIGEWGDFTFDNPKSFRNVYLIRWNTPAADRIYKFQVLDAREDAYHVRFGPLDNSFVRSIWIVKSAAYESSYLSLLDQEQTYKVEPRKLEWEICFTYLPDSNVNHQSPHLKTAKSEIGLYQGVSINNATAEIALDSSTRYEEIDYFYARSLVFSNRSEIHNLFYAWNTEDQKVEILENLTLIVKANGDYYAIKAEEIALNKDYSFSFSLRTKKL